MTFAKTRTVTILITALVLAACGGGSTTTSQDSINTASCNPTDLNTFDEFTRSQRKLRRAVKTPIDRITRTRRDA